MAAYEEYNISYQEMTTAGHEMLLSRKLNIVSLTACNNIKQNAKSHDAFFPLLTTSF